MFCVYAIQSTINAHIIYVGQTQSIETRLAEHNAGRVRSTRKHKSWRIIKLTPCETREEARWLEHQLKRSRGKRLKWLKSKMGDAPEGPGALRRERLLDTARPLDRRKC